MSSRGDKRAPAGAARAGAKPRAGSSGHARGSGGGKKDPNNVCAAPDRGPTGKAAAALAGRAVLRRFEAGLFRGTVLAARRTRKWGTLWAIRYSDGDAEEMDWSELREVLQPAWPPVPAPAAAAQQQQQEERQEHQRLQRKRASGKQKRARGAAGAPRHAPAGAAAAAAAGGALPAAPPAPRFKGVSAMGKHVFRARIYSPHDARAGSDGKVHLGHFDSEAAAARAHDAAARALGLLQVNFPRPGSAEVQAALRPRTSSKALRSTAAVTPKKKQPRPRPRGKPTQAQAQAQAPRRFKGVYASRGRWVAHATVPGLGTQRLGTFGSAEEAARAYDDSARARGKLEVNFPRPRSREVRAAPGAPLRAAAAPPPPARRKRPRQHAGAPAAKKPRVAAPLAAAAAAHAAAGAAAHAPSAQQQQQQQQHGSDGHHGHNAVLLPPQELADVVTFLRAISPPLSCLDGALAALPRSRVSMPRLAALAAARVPAEERAEAVRAAAAELDVTRPGDLLSFMLALPTLARGGS
jgi:hypothetical protein